jgi:hypothetical protein
VHISSQLVATLVCVCVRACEHACERASERARARATQCAWQGIYPPHLLHGTTGKLRARRCKARAGSTPKSSALPVRLSALCGGHIPRGSTTNTGSHARTRTHARTHTHTHTHTHAHTHTRTHTHTHAQTRAHARACILHSAFVTKNATCLLLLT